MINEMISKYCEIFDSALRAGLTHEQAHAYTAKWFETGFAYLAEKVGA